MGKKNFTLEEKNLLLDFVKNNAHILENKSSENNLIQARKEKWIELSDLFTSSGYDRDWQRLREYYQRVKSSAKKTISAFKNFQLRNGENVCPPETPSDFDWALHAICPADFSADHSESEYDLDQIIVTKTETPQDLYESSNVTKSFHQEEKLSIMNEELMPNKFFEKINERHCELIKKNFTTEEKNLLLEFVKNNVDILESKANDLKMIKARRQKWLELSNLFALNGYNRDWQRLREYYHRAKCSAKRAIGKFQKFQHEIGTKSSTPDPPSELDFAIYDICLAEFTADTSENDSDIQTNGLSNEKDPLDFSESSNASAPTQKKQKLNVTDEEFLMARIKFLEERNRREQELHQAKMRVEQLKMRNEELLSEKLKLEIESFRK